MRYNIHLERRGHSFLDAVRFLSTFKRRLLTLFSGSAGKAPHSVLEHAHVVTIPGDEGRTKKHASIKYSSIQEKLALAAFADLSVQGASKASTRRSVNKSGNKYCTPVACGASGPNDYSKVKQKLNDQQGTCQGSSSYGLLAYLRLQNTTASTQ